MIVLCYKLQRICYRIHTQLIYNLSQGTIMDSEGQFALKFEYQNQQLNFTNEMTGTKVNN